MFSSETAKDHWLEYADEKYRAKIINETKMVVNILVLYIPLPLYWAVYVQQGSRWVFQAKRMNGDIGFYTLKPDQMILFNSIIGILLIPICEKIIFPLVAKVGLKSNLQKMGAGGILAVIAFIISGFIEIKISNNYINMMWLLPQYGILTLSENFLYVANLNFAYAEAPISMKSAMQAFTFMTIAVGNVIVTIISGAKLFESQSNELFFFAAILFVDQILFAYLAMKYKYATHPIVEVKLIENPE